MKMPKHFTLEAVEGSDVLSKELLELELGYLNKKKKPKIVFSFSSGEREPRNKVEYELIKRTSIGWSGRRSNVFVFRKVEVNIKK